eukprot:TRINITY_DN335_c0_g1_i3.p1 TRINITY_DN335_c0_g1~~TRINITY_DN335_c0_g1_i3.p1  ORF type:complete len:143 (+),score=58.67 TRINITY_DN335_c0_g1_i3:43-471(+)
MSTENEQANLVNNVEEDDGYTKPASMIEKDSGDNTKRNAAAAGAGVVVLGAGAVAASVLLAPAALVGAGVLTGIGAYKYSKNNDKLAQEGSLSHVHLEIKSATGLKEGSLRIICQKETTAAQKRDLVLSGRQLLNLSFCVLL